MPGYPARAPSRSSGVELDLDDVENEDARVLTGAERRYEIESERGRGGFATTYQARVIGTEQRVLIKELRFDKVDSWKAVELFEREASALASLSHSGIPRFIESFAVAKDEPNHAPARFFLVQELVRGRTLAEHVETHGPLPFARAEALLREFLHILDYLHTRTPPLVHRDITPNNVLMGEDGRAHLIDFGAVQVREATATGGSTLVGTPGYMPMEQVIGQAGPAADVYALGVSLLFALSGKTPGDLPLDARTGEINVRRLLPGLPPRLVRVLKRMVKPAVGLRLASATQVLDALERSVPSRAPLWVLTCIALGAATLPFVLRGSVVHPSPADLASPAAVATSWGLTQEQRDSMWKTHMADLKEDCKPLMAQSFQAKAHIYVNADGSVKSVKVTGSDPSVNACVENSMRTWGYPPADGPTETDQWFTSDKWWEWALR